MFCFYNLRNTFLGHPVCTEKKKNGSTANIPFLQQLQFYVLMFSLVVYDLETLTQTKTMKV